MKENRSSKFSISDVILTITRWKGALYLGTTNGLYVMRDDTMTRFRLEPGLSGNFLFVAEQL